MKQVSNDILEQRNQTTLSIETISSKYVCKPKHEIDTIDLEIIKYLSRDRRASYRDILLLLA